MLQPTLTSARLRLVPLNDDHLPYEVELDSDPEVMRFVGAGQPRTVTEVQAAHVERMNRARAGMGFWAGFADTTFIGWWLLTPADHDPRGQAELGYRIAHLSWRQGFATEGASTLLDYAFHELGLSQVFAETMAVNAGSRGVMTRLGLQQIDARPSSEPGLIEGSQLGDVDYAVDAEKWQSVRPQRVG